MINTLDDKYIKKSYCRALCINDNKTPTVKKKKGKFKRLIASNAITVFLILQ